MYYSGLFSKSAKTASLLISAIAGSIMIASSSSISAPSANLQMMQIADRPTASDTTEVNRYAVMALALGGAVAVSVGLNAILGRNRSSSSVRRPLNLSLQSRAEATGFDQVSRSLQRRLLLLLHEDRGAAHRLLTQATFKYPGKTPNWYAEKVIYDLERDRGKV